jgi:HK97 gp10 family phage protein
MEVKIEGLQNLKADFSRVTKKVGNAADKGLQELGLEIVAEAKLNLNRNKTNTTGTLRASGKVQKDKDGVDAGFFSDSSSLEGYAAYVEYGRGPTQRAGTIPLRTTMKAWVHKKLGIPYGKELDRATYLITRKIHRKGTKPQPFFVPAVKKFEDKAVEIINKFIKEATR